jgi:transcription initiation factor TFIID TATA-box-binding protein
MRKRKYVSLEETTALDGINLPMVYTLNDFKQYTKKQNKRNLNGSESPVLKSVLPQEETKYFWPPIPQCHNIVSTSQISTSQKTINLQRISDMFPFTTYDRKRFAAITIRLANPHCTCLLFGSGKLVITGSTSFNACIIASHEVTRLLRSSSPYHRFEVISCSIQNIVAHVELPSQTTIDLDKLYNVFCECSTFQKTVFPGLVLRPQQSPIVLLVFASGRIVCTGGRSYNDIYLGFKDIFHLLKPFIQLPTNVQECLLEQENLQRVENLA